MSEKVLLVLVDGMRPDSLDVCGHPFIETMRREGSSTYTARTVMPSVTLPCHMSLFHSVPPERHGILTNTYVPLVRPLNGLCEQLQLAKKTSGFFYNWEQLRDLARPGSIACGYFASGKVHGYDKANELVTDEAVRFVQRMQPDFVFVYLGFVDEAGHAFGWMSEEYIRSVYASWDCIERIAASLPEEYTLIVTADHGGHDRSHGSDLPEDMTIPIFIKGKAFAPGSELANATIMDIAPTITKLVGAEPADEWEGKPLF